MTSPAFIRFDRPPASRAKQKAPTGDRKALVTVVTPYFDAGPEFRETALTVFSQTMIAFEWLIVDDGTTSAESLERLRDVEAADPRVRVIRHERNRGLSAARNTGFDQAAAEAVMMLDADDQIEPTALEKLFWYLLSFDAMSFATGYSVGFGAQEYRWERGFHDGDSFVDENLVNATCMIARSVHRAVGGFPDERKGGLEDWEFWLRCADAGFWGGSVPEYLDWYRRRENHSDRWLEFNRGGIGEFQKSASKKFGNLVQGRFPRRGSYRAPPRPRNSGRGRCCVA
jgi:glycosyltransferase involved in cell wall biosynthesis